MLSAGLTALVVHFCIVFLYSNPLQSKPAIDRGLAWTYTYPYFEQSWNLFAPIPSSNYTLYVQFKNGPNSAWKDVFQELQYKHRQNRLAGNEWLLLAFTNSIHRFETQQGAYTGGCVKENPPFRIIETLVQHLYQLQGTPKIMLVTKPVSKAKTRLFYN